MGKYSLFVWSCYGITLGLMIINVILALRKYKKTKAMVAAQMLREFQNECNS